MGNCCVRPVGPGGGKKKRKEKEAKEEGGRKLVVLEDPTGRDIGVRYEMGRELGRGEFGVTYLCRDKETKEELACKSISKKKLRTAIDVEDVRREVQIMRHLPPHPNVVSFKEAYEDDHAVHLVMELCEGGELFDRIVARGHYTERAAASVTRTIVQVVQMCHKHGVMHRDLKPENFLFANKKETAPLKAIDFGLSVFFKPGERFNEIVGSPYYMAPEVLKRNYGPEVDIWSAGVILYILLCGIPPFWAETEQGVAQAIIRSVLDFRRDPWPKVSDNAKDLVKKMLDPDPKRRLTAQEVLDHPWLQNENKAPNVSLGETVRTRLMQFSVMNKLKKRALRVIAEHLSIEEVAGIKEGFEVMDTGNNGKINIDELRVGLHKLGHQIPDEDVKILMEAVSIFTFSGIFSVPQLTAEELTSFRKLSSTSNPLGLLIQADVDRDGYLDYGEFVAISIHLRKIGHDEHLHKAFQFFDQNQSGYIEIEELQKALADEVETNSEEVINAIMHDVDTDKDGRISYEEFAAMMKAGTDWRKASRQYSRERFNTLSQKLMKDGSLQLNNDGRGL
ncbi:hypothetical protein Fmac_020455 [Flemingia macrophylla]|uniref:non-specific serine/threonine protein kinase n=1 Tax=Flemingia macrophylla TaxID=520843 RepID=A0ABD1LU24_9FABA